ncbi:hypothetical protein MASR2M117_18560 [Paludibacter sp.]
MCVGFMLSLNAAQNPQVKGWLFSSTEWLNHQTIIEPILVDEFFVAANVEYPAYIVPTSRRFVSDTTNFQFTRALKFNNKFVELPESKEVPFANAFAFRVSGPCYVEVSCLTNLPPGANFLLLFNQEFNVIDSIPINNMNYLDPFGSQVPVQRFHYNGGKSYLGLCPSKGAVEIYYIECDKVISFEDEKVPVTFNVTVPQGTNECWIAGDFNDWNHSMMYKTSDNTFSFNDSIRNIDDIEYKYCSGPNWMFVECDANGIDIPNRKYQQNDTVQRWMNIYDPNVQQPGATYTVIVPQGTEQVCIAGDFNGWSPGRQWMQRVEDNKFAIHIPNANPNMGYKYLNGPDWRYEEVSVTGEPIFNRNWHELDSVQSWKMTFIPDNTFLFYDDVHTSVGADFNVDIKLASTDSFNAISYQFELGYNTNDFEYIGFSTNGTISSMGDIVVNAANPGILHVSFMTTEPFDFKQTLVRLNFRVRNNTPAYQTNFYLGECYFNTRQIMDTRPGKITIDSFMKGDVDRNQRVQAYDAALTLQYSVGKDPLPNIDPLPWEEWRLNAADVDGTLGITAHDAAMILQFSAYMISSFDRPNPEGGPLKSPKNISANVEITKDDNKLIFKSYGNLIGFNLFIDNNKEAFGEPVVADVMNLKAVNTQNNHYAVGLAVVEPLPEGSVFMTIPLVKDIPADFEFIMFINENEVNVKVNAPSGLKSLSDSGIAIYPNPASDYIQLNNLEVGTQISLYDISGRLVLHEVASQSIQSFNISNLSNGIYSVHVKHNGLNAVSKIIKK